MSKTKQTMPYYVGKLDDKAKTVIEVFLGARMFANQPVGNNDKKMMEVCA